MRYVFLICTLLFSYIIQAQTIPQVNNIPWYEFTKKLSVGERFKIPQDTLSLPAGATVRDTTGLIALKNGTLYRLYNRSWRAVMNGIDSVNRAGDSIIFYNNGVRLARVYSPALTANNGTRIASSVIKLDDGTNPLTENVFIDGVTNSMDFGLNSRVGTWSLQRSMTYNGFAAGANDSVRFDINTMAVKFTGASAGDGNTTIGKKNAITTLSADLTGNRTLTFPYKINDPGFLLYIINKNTTAFDWIVAGAPVEDGNGTAITTIKRGLWFFMWDGSKWIRQAGGSSGTVTSVGTGTFLTGGPITTTGTVALDTANAALKAYIAANAPSNLIVQNKGVGQQTWYTSGDTLYKKRVDSTWALTWSTRTDSTLQANIDTARIATRAWVVGQGYGAGGGGSGWALTGNSISGADSVFGTTSNHGIKIITNNVIAGIWKRTGQLLLGSGTDFHGNTSALNISGSMTMTDTISIRKGTNAAFQFYSTGAGSAAIRTFNNATLTFNGDVISATKLYGTTYMQSPLYYGTSTLNLQTANSSSNNDFTIMNMTNINPGANSGTGYSRLVSMNKLIQRGTQDGTETVLRLDYTLTGSAADIRALDVVKGRTILTSLQTAVAAKTTAYTIGEDDYTITGDATSAAFSVTLPTAVGRAGKIHVIKKIDASANVVTVATTSSQTIDGATTYTALSAQWKYVTVQSDGANWIIIGNN